MKDLIGPLIEQLHLDLWTLLAFGVIAALLWLLIDKLFESSSATTRNVLFVLLALPSAAGLALWFGGPLLGKAVGKVLPKTPYEQALERVEARLETIPEWQQVKRSLPASRDEARKAGFELARKGARRLDDNALETRAVVIARLLDVVDETTCAAMARGAMPTAGLTAAIAKLDQPTVETWLDLAYEAMVAEMKQKPLPPSPSERERAAAVNAMMARMPKDHKATFQSAAIRLNLGTPDAEACWVAKTLYYYLPNLEEPHRRVLARALVQG
ncbi:MAG TPA: hypothetical protein VFN71_16060 [Methylomirabilota bacterium]|nr:hypothetical protein [Methylomirabilota bacterium]